MTLHDIAAALSVSGQIEALLAICESRSCGREVEALAQCKSCNIMARLDELSPIKSTANTLLGESYWSIVDDVPEEKHTRIDYDKEALEYLDRFDTT